jgi:hypothetical protein
MKIGVYAITMPIKSIRKALEHPMISNNFPYGNNIPHQAISQCAHQQRVFLDLQPSRPHYPGEEMFLGNLNHLSKAAT